MPKLVIVESPAKAKTINKYLGKDFRVKASMGHVRDLPKTKFGVDIEKDFAPTYVVGADRKKLIAELRKLAKSASEVYLATDLDREGEAIAWHLAEAMSLPAEKTRRVVFNEITKTAIREAFEHPSALNLNKVNAQQARRVLDRIVGYQISPLLWKRVKRGLSAGRVQSVAVRLIVEREREIENFKPEEYWEIEAELEPQRTPGQGRFKAALVKRDGEEISLSTEALTQQIVEELRSAAYSVSKIVVKERALPPPPPFNTSTLQQQGSTQLHFSARRTMMVAQRLYEGVELGPEGSVGLITYMRTDSLRVSDQAVADCRRFIGEHFPPPYLPAQPNVFRSGKDAQGAHEAVRPTSVDYTPERVKPWLDRDQFRLYEMIWNRFVASQMPPGRMKVTDVEIGAGRCGLEAQGRELLFDGHLKLTGFDRDSLTVLPPLTAQEPLALVALTPTRHETKPPPRYSEATLVKTLEKLGIGRPSTYAPIITTIQTRGYVKVLKRVFSATELGKVVTDQLVQHFGDIMDVKFTSHMEDRLDEVEEAKTDWVTVLREFYGPFSEDLKKAGDLMKRPEPEQTEYKCDKCGKPLLKRWSVRGPFLGCSGYPECRVTMAIDAEGKPQARPEPEATDQKCDKCGAPMVIRVGRHGRFLACSAYPKCKNAKSVEPPPEIPDNLKSCEKCGAPMAVRSGRNGRFLACTAYPKCRNTKNFDAPVAIPEELKTCDKCGKPMTVKRFRGRTFLGCTGYPTCKNSKAMPRTESGSAEPG